MDGVTYSIVFRWKNVPLTEESADYYGSMGEFRRLDKATDAYVMLQRLLGDEWELWINRNTEKCEKVFPPEV